MCQPGPALFGKVHNNSFRFFTKSCSSTGFEFSMTRVFFFSVLSRPQGREQDRDYGEREGGRDEGRPNWRQQELPHASSSYSGRYEHHQQRPADRAPNSYPSFSYEPYRGQNSASWRSSEPPPVENHPSVNRSSSSNYGRNQPADRSVPSVMNQGRHSQPAHPVVSQDRDQERSYNSYSERQHLRWTNPSVQSARDRSDSLVLPDVSRPPPSMYQTESNEDRYRSNSYESNDRPRSSASRSVDKRIRDTADRNYDSRPSSSTRSDDRRQHHHRIDDPPARTNPPSRDNRTRPSSSQEGAAGQKDRKRGRKNKHGKNAGYGQKDGAANWRAPTNSS